MKPEARLTVVGEPDAEPPKVDLRAMVDQVPDELLFIMAFNSLIIAAKRRFDPNMSGANYNCCFAAMLCLQRLMELPELPDANLAEESRVRAFDQFVTHAPAEAPAQRQIEEFWGIDTFPYPDTNNRIGCLRIAARSLYDLANDEEIIDNREYVSGVLFSIMLKLTEAMCCHGPISTDATGGVS